MLLNIRLFILFVFIIPANICWVCALCQTPEPRVFHVMEIKIRKLRLRELRNLLKVTELQWHLSGWDLKLVLSQFAVCAPDKGDTLCLCFHYIWEMVASVLPESKCLSRSIKCSPHSVFQFVPLLWRKYGKDPGKFAVLISSIIQQKQYWWI